MFNNDLSSLSNQISSIHNWNFVSVQKNVSTGYVFITDIAETNVIISASINDNSNLFELGNYKHEYNSNIQYTFYFGTEYVIVKLNTDGYYYIYKCSNDLYIFKYLS